MSEKKREEGPKSTETETTARAVGSSSMIPGAWVVARSYNRYAYLRGCILVQGQRIHTQLQQQRQQQQQNQINLLRVRTIQST